MKNKKKVINISIAAIVAALYVVLTYFASAVGLSSGVIQIRFSEALTILPIFTPAAIPGLFIGCFISNILTNCAMWDIIFGSLATLIGAMGTYFLRKRKFLAVFPPILANTLIIPPILMYVYAAKETFWFITATVCLGEIISCGILGTLFRRVIEKTKIFERL